MQKFSIFILSLLLLGRLDGDETEAVKQRTQSYVSAYNSKNAKGLADHWASDAQRVDPETGKTVQGREAIENEFKDLLQEGGNLQVEIYSVEFPSRDRALEKGKAVITQSGQPKQETLFQTTFVKQNGQWNINKIDEVEWREAPTNYAHLKDLEWLIGMWNDKSDTFDIKSKYEWDKYKNFITHSFEVSLFGKPDIEGKQIIGWDPANEQVHSWMFDSDGGFAESTWKKEGQYWVVHTTSTLPDGAIGTQTTIITPIDRNSYTLEITDRDIDGELLPNLAPVKIVRMGGV